MDLKFLELFKELSEIKTILENVLSKVNPEEVPWDNSDIIRNWKVSERTLSDWRKKGLIAYVQVQGKIWYPRSSREAFMNKYSISAKNENVRIEYQDGDFMVTKNEGRVRS